MFLFFPNQGGERVVYLMRHGQDDENYIGGWSKVGLTKEGKMEVIDTALWIKDNLHITKVISSDIKRAMQTADIVCDILKLAYLPSTELREQNKGLLNGMLQEKAEEEYHDLLSNVTVDTIYPEGESLRDLYNRIKEYLEKLMTLQEDTLLITHRGVINMIYFVLNNRDVDMDKKQFGVTPASVHELDIENRTIKKVR